MAKSDISGPSPSVCIIGAGFGGLTVAIQLKRKLGLETFTIFEKNNDLGGTWLVNAYPGAQCDIPSIIYSWSFEPNYEWSRTYAKQPEILEYMRNAAKKYDLYSHLKTRTCVISCIWNDKFSKWEITWVDNKSGIEGMTSFDILVVGVSFYWNPHTPELFHNFNGIKMHSAQWDHSVDLENKIVGVVGSAASAVQLIPEIVSKVKELHSFQRSPTWVYPKPMDFIYGLSFRWFKRNFIGLSKWYMRRETSKKPEVYEQIIPLGAKKLFFCRMPSLNTAYVSALCSSNVRIHRGNIKDTRENLIVLENGTEIKLDVLILATGFQHTKYFGPLKIIGDNGIDILKSWTEKGVNTYYGICTRNTKNLFFIHGPQSAIFHSAVYVMECQATYLTNMISHMMKENLSQFQVKPEAETQYLEIRENVMKKSIFAPERCKETTDARYFDLVNPANGAAYRKQLSRIKIDDYNFK